VIVLTARKCDYGSLAVAIWRERIMRSQSGAAILFICFFLVGEVGRAADRHVHFRVPPPVADKIAAMPQIIDPADAAESRINAALSRLDENVRKAAEECKSFAPDGFWERSIDVPTRGPGYLSFVITDFTDCGGNHPNTSVMSIVYDLRTGAPVDWTQLLPGSLTGTLALQKGQDGTKMVTLASQRLFELYLAGYRAANPDPACVAEVERGLNGPPGMMAWLDAKVGGLALQFDLFGATRGCSMPIVIPIPTLSAEGVKPELLESIRAAQSQ
jgi:hypothetical protein